MASYIENPTYIIPVCSGNDQQILHHSNYRREFSFSYCTRVDMTIKLVIDKRDGC